MGKKEKKKGAYDIEKKGSGGVKKRNGLSRIRVNHASPWIEGIGTSNILSK